MAHDVWGTVTEAVVFSVARQLERGFPAPAPTIVSPHDDEDDERPFRVHARLAVEFAALADAPDAPDYAEQDEGVDSPQLVENTQPVEGDEDAQVHTSAMVTDEGLQPSPPPYLDTHHPGGLREGQTTDSRRRLEWEDTSLGIRIWTRHAPTPTPGRLPGSSCAGDD